MIYDRNVWFWVIVWLLGIGFFFVASYAFIAFFAPQTIGFSQQIPLWGSIFLLLMFLVYLALLLVFVFHAIPRWIKTVEITEKSVVVESIGGKRTEIIDIKLLKGSTGYLGGMLFITHKGGFMMIQSLRAFKNAKQMLEGMEKVSKRKIDWGTPR